MSVTIKVTLHKNKPYVDSPHLSSSGPARSAAERESKGFYATTGVGPDLLEASKAATRSMIAWLSAEHNLSGSDAYMLCSVACDLRITGKYCGLYLWKELKSVSKSRRDCRPAQYRRRHVLPALHLRLGEST